MLVSLLYVCMSVYHTIKCGRIVTQLYIDIIIPTLSRNITGIGLMLKSPNL